MFGVKSLSTTLRKVFLLPAQIPHSDENLAEPMLGLNESMWGWSWETAHSRRLSGSKQDWEELIPWLLHQSLGEALVLWWGSAFRAISEVSRKAAEGRSQISLGDDRG